MNLIAIPNQILLTFAIIITVDNKNIQNTQLQKNDQNVSQIHSKSQMYINESQIDHKFLKELIPSFVNLMQEFSKNYQIGFVGLCFHNPSLEKGKFTPV